MMPLSITELRGAVEEFLFHEAALLDDWRLEEWLQLLTDDATYEIPALDLGRKASNRAKELFLVADDAPRIRARAKQLIDDTVWAENPRSRTRRLITNVRVCGSDDETVSARANFVIYRFRHGNMDLYVGEYEHTLLRVRDSFKFKKRRVVLDLDALRPQPSLSIIL